MAPMGWEGIFVFVWYIKGFKYIAKETSKSQEKKVFWWTFGTGQIEFSLLLFFFYLTINFSWNGLLVKYINIIVYNRKTDVVHVIVYNCHALNN